MSYHVDRGVNRKIVELLDELCELERANGDGSTLILIPSRVESPVTIAVDGKPAPHISVDLAIKLGIERRGK